MKKMITRRNFLKAAGVSAAALGLEDVKHYAKLAAANEFVEKMPDGYETIVGERGVEIGRASCRERV